MATIGWEPPADVGDVPPGAGLFGGFPGGEPGPGSLDPGLGRALSPPPGAPPPPLFPFPPPLLAGGDLSPPLFPPDAGGGGGGGGALPFPPLPPLPLPLSPPPPVDGGGEEGGGEEGGFYKWLDKDSGLYIQPSDVTYRWGIRLLRGVWSARVAWRRIYWWRYHWWKIGSRRIYGKNVSWKSCKG